MKPLIYGYLRITDDLDDHEILRMEHGLQELAEAEGLCFATTFYEYQTGYHGGFDELLRNMMLARLAREADAHLWMVAP